MTRLLRLGAMTSLALVLPSPTLLAQGPTDFVKPTNPASVRVIGLGGAFVGLVDDSSATILNPAGLSKVPRSLEGLAGVGLADGGRPHGVSLGFRPGRWWAVGLQWAGPAATAAHAVAASSPRAALPSTEANLSDFALGAAATVGSHNEWSAGASFRWSRLSIPGVAPDADGAPSYSAGVLFRPVNPWSPRLGLSYRHKTDWEVTDRDRGVHRIRGVSVVSGGASWYYEPEHWFRLLVSLQPDLVLYSQLNRDQEDAGRARNDVDLRTGVEATFPFDCWIGCGSMIQVRAGLLNSAVLPFSGSIASSQGLGESARRVTSWSVGAAVALRQVLHGRLKFEAAYDWRSDALAFGLGYRFPGAFRAEIVDATRQ